MSWDWVTKAHELQQGTSPFAIVTIVDRKGSAPRDVGAKMIVTEDDFFGTVGGGQLESQVIEHGRECLKQAVTERQKYPLCLRTGQCCGGAVETLVEIMGIGPELYLFGAGHVGQAICRALQGTPFRVHLVDERSEWIHHRDLPPSIVRHQVPWQEFVSRIDWDRHRSCLLYTSPSPRDY